MIEATCSACGTQNRVSEANVPVGAKFITCTDCKARVAIAAQPPPVPKPATAAKPTDLLGLADLPAPKRASALGAEPSRPRPVPPVPPLPPASPPPRSGLASALDPDLPAPRAARAPAAMPAISSPTLDIDDPRAALGDSADLPAPKRPAARAAEPARDAADDITDLPAPRPDRGVADLPAPKRTARRVDPGGPAPQAKEPPAITDLPAPKRGPNQPDLPTPRMTDLQPKRYANAELPAPKGFFDDAPKASSSPGVVDLPAPKGFFDDLAGPQSQDPGPGGEADLPAPKGYFDDLPQPALQQRPELPAPKGFFDDLPQPALQQRPDLPAPKGYFEDIPQVKTNPSTKPDLPAPKGYFEDIPQVKANPSTKPDLPAPKGFFDDIPGLPHTAKPELPAPQGFFDDIPGLPHKAKPEVPAPKGHFENVPGRPVRKTDDLAPKGFFDDLQARPAGQAPGTGERATHRSKPATRDPGRSSELELDSGADLELVAPAAARPGSFDDLDLSQPSPAPVRFDPPARASGGRAPVSELPPPRFDAGPALELEGAMPSDDARPAGKRLAKPAPAIDDATAARARKRRRRLVLGGLVAVAVLGAGGAFLYRRHVAAEERAQAIAEQLQLARKSYAAADPGHWQRAATAARRVLELDDKHAEALGLGAESLFASALAEGTGGPAKLTQARALLDTANAAGLANPQLARARALSRLAAHQPDTAITQLQPLAARAPRDAVIALYLGWAHHAKGDPAAAVKSYDTAIDEPATQIAALYGRGNAKLELADLEGARADFTAVLERAKDHIGAQVGLAAAQPPSAAQQQETDLIAILARKDIAAADPRAVARAWTLAGSAAARAGRGAVARERFRKALAIVPQDLAATTGLAEVELREGKLAAAAELTAAALQVAKDNVPAQLVQSEIELQQGKLPLASQRLAALANHATPLAPLEQARLELITGKLLEAQGKDDEAVEAYMRGAKLARELDLAPMMAAVGKLAALTAAAIKAKDTARADALRGRSEILLGELAQHAERDPRLAMTLGMAYLQDGNASKAAMWLGRAADARPGDPEARFQLGRALLKAGKSEPALEALNAAQAAAVAQDPARTDIGIELAAAYEALGRDAEAGARYAKLLAGPEPSIELRARAGMYFARVHEFARAGEQGAKILEAEPGNPRGQYLKGEGLLAGGKLVEAKQAFQAALEAEGDPRYHDALGRAAEALGQGGERELQDLAIRSYTAALEGDPAMFSALVGLGRLHVARREAAKALPSLLAAARIEPKHPEVMFLTGAAYQELQQAQIALQWLEASTRIAPRAEAYWRIGQLYRDGNQGARAAEAITTATRLAENTDQQSDKPVAWLTDALYLQGRVYLDMNNEPRARDAWRRYLARNPPRSPRRTEVEQQLATRLRER